MKDFSTIMLGNMKIKMNFGHLAFIMPSISTMRTCAKARKMRNSKKDAIESTQIKKSLMSLRIELMNRVVKVFLLNFNF